MRLHCPGSFAPDRYQSGTRAGRKPLVEQRVKSCKAGFTVIDATSCRTFGEGQALKKRFKRRNAIEPVIAHEKQDHGLGRNYLKGKEGEGNHAIWTAKVSTHV
jgi:hypothetical protein